MERIDEVKSKLRMKKQEYQSLRNDYEIIKQNIKTNLEDKKAMRKEIAALTKEYQTLKILQQKKDLEEDKILNGQKLDTGTDSLL